jgi:F-type H+-transporting ATPase subunit b
MEFDLTTFLLETINFIILVWLLKHFFYRPVLAIIEKRQAETAQTVAQAQSLRSEAEAVKNDYETRLSEIENEGASATERLNAQMESERKRQFDLLEKELDQKRKRYEALQERDKAEQQRVYERQAIALAGRFASRLFDRLASPHLNDQLADLAVEELGNLSEEKRQSLDAVLHESDTGFKVISAYSLDSERQSALKQALSDLAERDVLPEFSQDRSLKAGVCIMAGSWVLMVNLRDELTFFSEH